MLTINEVYKHKVNARILENINLNIPEGIFGILGPNGAGKTTLLQILSTVDSPTKGSITFNNISWKNPRDIRGEIGYLPQSFYPFNQLTTFEAIKHYGYLKSHKLSVVEAESLLEEVNLLNFRDVRVKKLSGGMKRRLGIAQAILGDPKIIIVDEPTTGLDILERVRFRELLRKLGGSKTIIISSHIVEDLETVCDYFAIMDRGRILTTGSKVEILKNTNTVIKSKIIKDQDFTHYTSKYNVSSFKQLGGGLYEIRIITNEKIKESNLSNPNLEECYLKLITSEEKSGYR